MGCMTSTPVLPDGDGVQTLPWLPNENDKHQAGHKSCVGLQPHQITCRILINQEAIWNKLSGVAAETLPYPPEDGFKEVADYKHPLAVTAGARGVVAKHQRPYRFSMNQEAIWNKLSGGAVETLPYPAEDGCKEAADYKHFAGVQSHQRVLRILINQEAIWNKLSGGAVETFPYPADDNCKAMACRGQLIDSRECRIWQNQEAIFNKLPGSHF